MADQNLIDGINNNIGQSAAAVVPQQNDAFSLLGFEIPKMYAFIGLAILLAIIGYFVYQWWYKKDKKIAKKGSSTNYDSETDDYLDQLIDENESNQ